MRFHAPTAFTTLGVVGLVAILSAQQIVGSPAITVRRIIEPAVVYTPAHPKDIVRIVEGQPFVVPPGRILVITAIGTVDHRSAAVDLWINGTQEARKTEWTTSIGSEVTSTYVPIPSPGLAAASGDTVEVKGGANIPDDARALGFLADA